MQGCTLSNIEATKISESTSTSDAVLQTSVVSNTSTPATSFQEDLSCWPIQPLEQGENIKGSILFEKQNGGSIWDISSFHTISLEGITQSDSYVSPDGSIIANLLRPEHKILLFSQGKTSSFVLPEEKYGSVYFLANGLIMIKKDKFDLLRNYKEGTGFIDEYFLLDPLTGIITTQSVLLKEFATGGPLHRFPVEYSPDLGYVIYSIMPDKDGNPRFARMDLKTQEIVWTGPFMPHWMPDGKTLTYLLLKEEKDMYGYFHRDNFYSISESGQTIQLTQFDRKSLALIREEVSWSPNGQHLIFKESQPGLSLFYIWDDQNKIAFRPCLPDENRAYTDYRALWSFDGSFIFLRLVYPDNSVAASEAPPPTTYKDLIIDIESKTILELPIAEDITLPIGWVNLETP